MAKYRKLPLMIDAVKNDGEWSTIQDWLESMGDGGPVIPGASTPPIRGTTYTGVFEITTRNGATAAQVGDWIIKGTDGSFYPCKPDVFKEVYERVDAEG